MSTELRANLNIFEIIEDYNKKVEEIPVLYKEILAQISVLKSNCTTMGAYGGQIFSHDFSWNSEKNLLLCLKKSSWRFVYNALKIEHIAPKTHLKEFENLLEDPPEFTEDNIRSIFKDYVTDPRGMTLAAFAEVFCGLDKFYKSHSNIKVGVKGLPKRIIITDCNSFYSYGTKKLADVINCLMRFRGKYDLCLTEYNVMDAIKKDDEYHGLTFKHFLNGNCHIIFDKQSLTDINRALAEYYGDVLPDAYEHTDKKATSKEVSKDLQFYRTPKKTVDYILSDFYFKDNFKILEPSCGDGALLDGIREKCKGLSVSITGVEYSQERCELARQKGFVVHQDNFLTWKTKGRFNAVIMNPPFYGKHYAEHIDKAYSLLSDDGVLVSILPITAQLNHGILDKKYKCRWSSLPLRSFSESGTNINTCLVRIYKS